MSDDQPIMMPTSANFHSAGRELLALPAAVQRAPESFDLPQNATLTPEAKARMKRALQQAAAEMTRPA